MKIEHRGPDKTTFLQLSDYDLFLGFHRLAIMDTSVRGDQPFVFEDDDRQIYVICNGEIYNYTDLFEELKINHTESKSDCEIILHLYKLIGGEEMIKKISGEFAFCVCEINKLTKEVKLFIGRDNCGKRELYISGNDNEVVICSELKASPFLFLDTPYYVDQFKPRHYLEISNFDLELCNQSTLKYTQWLNYDDIKTTLFDFEETKRQIRETLITCVEERMVSEREIGCLLSGGLDSSLVASIASNYCKSHGTVLKTYSIGLESGSTDKEFAIKTAEHIGSVHMHIVVTEQECVQALKHVIYCIESYDITTCRASVMQYLLTKWINENTNIHVILVGEGPDEMGGYMYFHNSPSTEEFHKETLRLINDTHYFDVLRAGKATAINKCEIRIPYLDNKYVSLMFSIDPSLRRPTNKTNKKEKWLVRESFTDTDILPLDVLHRPKESLSDGCSAITRSWFQILRDYIDTQITDEEYEENKNNFIHIPPISKDSYYFRKIFTEHFGHHIETSKVLPYYWLPSWVDGDGLFEPSARVLNVYDN
jgi:asparagine synthase (glutamine-hydrolysing)